MGPPSCRAQPIDKTRLRIPEAVDSLLNPRPVNKDHYLTSAPSSFSHVPSFIFVASSMFLFLITRGSPVFVSYTRLVMLVHSSSIYTRVQCIYFLSYTGHHNFPAASDNASSRFKHRRKYRRVSRASSGGKLLKNPFWEKGEAWRASSSKSRK